MKSGVASSAPAGRDTLDTAEFAASVLPTQTIDLILIRASARVLTTQLTELVSGVTPTVSGNHKEKPAYATMVTMVTTASVLGVMIHVLLALVLDPTSAYRATETIALQMVCAWNALLMKNMIPI